MVWVEVESTIYLLDLHLDLNKDLSRPIYFKPKVLFTDTDTFQHANYLTYVRFCQRAIRQAVTESLRADGSTEPTTGTSEDQRHAWPRQITADVMRKGVKTARLRYFKECVAGDDVTVHVWEEEEKPYWAFFSVETETPTTNILRFQMSLEYFKS
ncbi:hypothetical protein PoB_002055500 [Plakobranchus ocellatus]|uniref:Uncharacterized protein n=1 Tax=Plakobranchus ocellatus TaxID=259542 RepID=A0AAV3ZFY1_9GAST|nr:hypothetical protein PoB_002055500 [Plakobranchus ocellatus]